MTDQLVTAGIDCCRRAGLSVTRPADGGQPPAVAQPRSDGTRDATGPFPSLVADGRPVAVEPIRDPSPTLVLSRLWNDHRNGRAALFVVPDRERAARIETLLADPVGVRAADDRGRTFYSGPDRVPLAEGGYAAVPAGTDLRWRESTTVRAISGIRADATDQTDADPSALPDDSTPDADGPWLELLADDEVLVRLAGVDALDCPARERFPYAYARDRDKQIRVVDFAGRPVQRYPGIGAMRDDGFRPVPAPLVPEHMFDAPVDGWWAVVVADEDTDGDPP
ncbi:hypothetical protein ACOZ4L_10955 [Haloplanus ruber]|uniref:Uncharacterized protein n=1 Tax=Haloplanus ruber TaxID=869892 RepID=A0ABD6CUT4_9EURY|nr:hypothetical protein [Haloplanus ruber]